MSSLYTRSTLSKCMQAFIVAAFVILGMAAPAFAQLSGSYTIDPVGGNYTSISAAVSALTSSGVSGPVTFNIAPATYAGNITIPAITGASATNTITFIGQNAATCIVEYNTSSSYSYVFRLDGADYIRIRNLTINATGATYGYGIHLTNQADYNEITGCNVNVSTTSTNTICMAICATSTSSTSSDGNWANHTLVQNNSVSGGYYCIRFNGAGTATTCVDNRVIDNTVSGYHYYGIYYDNNGQAQVRGNTVEHRGSTVSSYGVYLNYCNMGPVVTGNKIIAGTYGVRVGYANIDSTTRGLVANNMVVCNGTSTNYGLYLYYSYMMDAWYNNVNMLTSTGTGYGLYTSNATANPNMHHDLRNNIVKYIGTGTFYPVYSSEFSAISHIAHDYNNYYAPNTTPSYRLDGSNTYTSLAAVQVAQPSYFQHCKEVDPLYTSDTDLHIAEPLLNGAAQAIATITTDFDGQTRNATNPDIGADEFFPPTDDAGIAEILQPMNFCPGNNSVIVRLYNFGINNITSATINWSVNGVPQTPYSWTGTLGTTSSSAREEAVTIGSYTFAASTPYTIRAWTSLPNAQTDPNTLNDTTEVTRTASMSGTFTIGGASPDFTDIASAITAVTNTGVCGPVVFTVNPGTYTGPFDITAIPGASSTNTVTFQGTNASTCILEYNTPSSYNYVLCLDGADYIRIRDLTINATGTSYGTGILLTNQADYNEIKDCFINVSNSVTAGNAAGIIASTRTSMGGSGNHANYNLIEGNTITGGYYGMHLYGAGSATNCVGNQVIDNTVTDWYYYGIRCYYQGELNISGNTVAPRSASSTTTYGIYLYYSRGGSQVTKNKVQSVIYGIYLNYANQDSTTRGLVANNMIVMTGTGSNYGIYTINSFWLNIWHNSINLLTPTGTGYGMYMTGAVNCAHDARNNTVKYNNGTGTFYTFYVTDITPLSFVALDYNNGYRAIGTVQYYCNATYWDRAGIIAGYPGYNAHTLEVDPGYLTDYDLHTQALALNAKGTPVTGVTDDIDGDTRSASTPDIGADEFAPPTLDIALEAINIPANTCGLGATETITVTLRNLAGGTHNASVNPIPVSLQITGPITQSFNATMNAGTIPSGDAVTFTVSTSVNFSTPGLYTLTATSALVGDEKTANDSFGPITMRADELIAVFPYSQDFETSDGNWTPKLIGASLNNDWQWGHPNYTGTGTITTANSGQNAWVTNLTGMYSQNSEAALESPCFNFTGMTAPMLVFYMNYYSEYDWDGLIVEGSGDGGATWSKLTPVSPAYTCLTSSSVFAPPFYSTEGADNTWKKYVFDLSAYANITNAKVRFHYFSDEFTTGAGWAIDDILVGEILERDITVTHVQYDNAANFWARIIGLPHTVEATIENRGYEDNPASVLLVYKEQTNPADQTDGVAETFAPVWSGNEATVSFSVPHIPAATGIMPFFVRAFHVNDGYAGNDFAMTLPNVQDSRTVGYEDFELLTPPAWEKYWTVANVNGGETWNMMATTGNGGTNGATYPGDVTAADDWLITPVTDLNPGSSYSLAFKYRSRNGAPQTIEVAYGSTPNPATMTTFVSFNGFTNTTFANAIGPEGVAPFFNTSTTPQVYYIGIHVVSGPNAGEVDIDNIRFFENPTPPPKIAYGENGVFITDPTIPITFSGVYKKTGLLSKTFTVTNATGKYGNPVGDMLWDVTGSENWFTLIKSTPDPLSWLTTNPYNPPWLRQDQTFTLEVNASIVAPGKYESSISIDAYLYNEDFPNGIRASNALFTIPVELNIIETGGPGQPDVVVATRTGLNAAGNPWIFMDSYSNVIATVWVTQGTIPTFSIKSHPGQLPSHVSRFRYVKHYWTIEADGTGWLADVQFNYFDSEVLAGFVQREDLLTGMRLAPNSAFWQNPIPGTTSISNPSGNYVMVTGISPTNHTGELALAHSWLIPLKGSASGVPQEFTLEQNYPNPFNPETAITFGVPEDAAVTLVVTNSLGEEVARIADSNVEAGYHTVLFDARDLPSGMYLYTLKSGSFTSTKTMIVSK